MNLFLVYLFAIFWPIPSVDQVHPLGNNWGEYQNYGAGGYFHNGIDILTPDTTNVEVRAVADGWVKAWGTIQEGLHYRIAVCDSPLTYTGRAEGWLYAHIDPDLPHKNLGDQVRAGEIIGYLVPWPVDSSFDHLHFARISDTGATWQRFPNPTWWFVRNPLLDLIPNTDLEPPVFENARYNWRFAFCLDNQNNLYLHPDSITGDVDIIARIYDRTGFTSGSLIWDRLAPYQIEYMIRRIDGLVIKPWTLSVKFSNLLDRSLVNVVYKYDNVCRSKGDYSAREYYFIITNTDGDSLIEPSDLAGKWETGLVRDDRYWIIVRAMDVVGNSTVDSMLVCTRNGVMVDEISESVLNRPLSVVPSITRHDVAVNLTLSSPTTVEIRLIDPAGRLIQQARYPILIKGSHTLKLRPKRPGIYTVEIKAGGYRQHHKIVYTD